MAWQVPPTWTAGQTIPASNLNIIRDDLLETAVAKATTSGRWFIATGTNSIAERAINQAEILTQQTTATTGSYVDLATVGPTVSSVATGTAAMIFVGCQMFSSTTAN